ncbi:MAG: recombination-associated protein RdgC [Planctomycetota bacterium]
MPRFRKSGSFTRCHVEGPMPKPGDEALVVALAKQRFRSIENAASEEHSVGWVSPGDATGGSFLVDEILLDPHVRLRVRLDRKRLPRVWVQIHLDSALRAREGRPPSAKERKELKDEIASRLLPRVLPSVGFVDLFWDPKEGEVYVFTTSRAGLEAVQKLWHQSFGSRLVETTPLELAFRAGLGKERLKRLERLAPVPFVPPPGETGRAPARRAPPAAAAAGDEGAAAQEAGR